MSYFRYAVYTTLIAAIFSIPAFAQETQTKVVDEVVAQVNEGVITLSRIRREKKNLVDSFIQEGKTREEAEKMVNEKENELIANMINEELLIQKAKESGLDSNIEAALNERFLDIMKQYNLKTVEQLYAEMEKNGVDPKEIREVWRKQAVREQVIQREVQAKVYWRPNGKELKEYYEKHKAKFTTPETISLSELFLGFAGRDEAAVREKAKEIHAQLKGGADWAKVVKENGDPAAIMPGTGKAENLPVSQLGEKVVGYLKDVKAGDVTAPFDVDQLGVAILRVDARTAASDESKFDENAVRLAIMAEQAPAEQKKFMASLREDSLIKINDTYRPLVAPILFADERKETSDKTP